LSGFAATLVCQTHHQSEMRRNWKLGHLNWMVCAYEKSKEPDGAGKLHIGSSVCVYL